MVSERWKFTHAHLLCFLLCAFDGDFRRFEREHWDLSRCHCADRAVKFEDVVEMK